MGSSRAGRGLLVASLLVAAWPTRSLAQPIEGGVRVTERRPIEERRFAARPFELSLRGGAGTIVGELGVTASYSPWSFLALGGGAGVNAAGGQLGAFIDLRPITFLSQRWARLHAIGIELGYSTGPWNDYGIYPGSITSTATRVHWAEPLIFYQTRSYRGFDLLAGVGVAIPFAKSAERCVIQTPCGPSSLGAVTNATVALGYAWGGSS